jgi:hypothetical protein
VEGVETVAVKFFRALALSLLPSLALAEPLGWAPNITATATWDSNVTNADRSSDVIGALQLRADLATAARLALDTDNALIVSAHLVAESWPRSQGLDQLSVGPRVGWQHKFGLGAFAPVFAVELAGDLIFARETERSARAGSLTLLWRKRFDTTTRLAFKQEFARRDARELLFDRTGAETSLELAHDLDELWSLSFTARWRKGDVLSYATPPRPDLVALAHVREAYDFFGRSFVAYSLETHSLSGSIAATRALGLRTWLIVCYEARRTERSPMRYVNHLVSTALVRQF